MVCFVARIFSQNHYPDFSPVNVSVDQDRDQRLWQLGFFLSTSRHGNLLMLIKEIVFYLFSYDVTWNQKKVTFMQKPSVAFVYICNVFLFENY
jgi:hypothetical protein